LGGSFECPELLASGTWFFDRKSVLRLSLELRLPRESWSNDEARKARKSREEARKARKSRDESRKARKSRDEARKARKSRDEARKAGESRDESRKAM